MSRTVLIVGVTGIAGYNTAQATTGAGWRVLGLSRSHRYDIPGVEQLRGDVLDPESLDRALQSQEFSHVVFTTWSRQETEAENQRVNGAMLANLLAAAGRASKLEHVALVTGLKHYLGPFEAYGSAPADTPFRESQERLPVDNFYYDQEDILFAEAEKQGFSWSVHRPHTLIGYALGNVMNMGVTLAVYGAICRATGEPFVFPGSPQQLNGVTDLTDARLLGRHVLWSSTEEKANNEAFNTVNGEVFRWRQLWPQVADALGVPVGEYPGHPLPLEHRMSHTDEVWAGLVDKHDLAPCKASELASWWHTDADLGREVETFADMSKSRSMGFLDHQSTIASFTDLFHQLRVARIIPGRDRPMLLPGGLGHLTYSTLVHPGDTWPEMWDSLQTYVPPVKARVSPDAPFGVSLRLSGNSAATLAESEALHAELRDFLRAANLYVHTVNAFPHGPFKGRTVMEDAYEPDWSTQVRLDYATQVADVLADIAAPGVRPTIQTAPLAYRAKVLDESYAQLLGDHLMRAVAHLVELERRTGVQVAIALEPEPACWLETTAETVRFFEDRIYSAKGRRAFSSISGEPLSRVEDLLRRHLGVVFDICHQSVGFEDIRGSLEALVAAGVPILTLQAASALRVPHVTPDVVNELEAFTDTIYLSQTTERRDKVAVHHLHLADAIPGYRRDPSDAPPLGNSAVRALGDRDLHVGCAADAPRDWRHRGLRDTGTAVGARPARPRVTVTRGG